MSIGAWILTIFSWVLGIAYLYWFGIGESAKTIYIPLAFIIAPVVIWKITEPKTKKELEE